MTQRTFPKSHLLNVGLARNDGKPDNTPGAVNIACYNVSLQPIAVNYAQSTTERTAIIQLDEKPTAHQLRQLCVALAQDCIATVELPSAKGRLVGPKAAVWGPFDPSQFLFPNGRPLKQYGQAPELGAKPGIGHTVNK